MVSDTVVKGQEAKWMINLSMVDQMGYVPGPADGTDD